MKIGVIGARKGNIGEAICEFFDQSEIRITGEIGIHFDESDLRDYDCLVFAQGYTDQAWIGEQGNFHIAKEFESNVIAPMMLINEMVCHSSKPRTIIFIGSMAHKCVLNGSSSYCASKAALMHYVRCAAYELAPKGWRIFCINPGNVLDTPMTRKVKLGVQQLHGLNEADAEKYWGKCNQLGRFITKYEIAQYVEFLLSPQADHLIGSEINLTGGNR